MPSSPNQYVSQFATDRRPLIVWLTLVVVVALFTSAIIGAPLALASNHTFLGLTIYQGFSHLCHQMPERSFFIAGHKFAVCARCTGLYAGFGAAVFLYPLVRSLRRKDTPERKWLFLAALPLVIDFGLTFFDIRENTHWSRFSTGALLGAVAVFFVMPGLVEVSTGEKGLWSRKGSGPGHSSGLPDISPDRMATAPSDYSAPERRI
jgi:uncharacterized membrane protein